MAKILIVDDEPSIRGRVLSREQLLEKVWGGEYVGEMRVVDVHWVTSAKELGVRI